MDRAGKMGKLDGEQIANSGQQMLGAVQEKQQT